MKLDFKRKILKNGMTLLFEKRAVPVVSVAFAVRNGGVNENLSEKGISHFIEHMLYKGTPTRDSKKIGEEIERLGGQMNGFTDEEITAYWCKMPSKHLKVALEVLGDMIKNPKFDELEIEKERKVIFEEIKMRKDIPQVYVFDEIQKSLYEGIMDISLIGNINTMNSIDRKKLLERFKSVYTPNNLILCVIGDADFREIKNFAENLFEANDKCVPEQKFWLKNQEKVETRKGIDQANLIFAYHVPFGEDKKSYAAAVLNALLAEGFSSRLFNEIREKRNLAYAIKGGCEINKRFGYNIVYAGTTKDNVEKIKELILNELKDVAKNLSEKELNEVKNQMIGQYQIGMEDSQSQMLNLLSHEIIDNAENFYDYEDNIKNVKLSDVKEIAKFASEKFSFFALIPE
jgi:predicted Zn-dependent peptidase